MDCLPCCPRSTEDDRMSLVHITHYNDEGDSAERTIDLTGSGGASDNAEVVDDGGARSQRPAQAPP